SCANSRAVAWKNVSVCHSVSSASKAISVNIGGIRVYRGRWQHRAMSEPSELPLAVLTGLVERVRATSRKTEKVALIAEALRQAPGEDAALLAMFLTGALRQGRIGVGWSAIEAALGGSPVAGDWPLTLGDLDRAFDTLAGERGAGSVERRGRALRGLFAR